MKNKRRQNTHHISHSFGPNTKKTKSNRVLWLFGIMALFVTLFFFGYQYYIQIADSYEVNIVNRNYVKKENSLSKKMPTTFLVVGMSFQDAGRIEQEEAISWNIVTLNPKTKMGLVSTISPELVLDDQLLFQVDAQHQQEQVMKQIERLTNQKINHYVVMHLSQSKPLLDILPKISVLSPEDMNLEDVTFTQNNFSLLSSRQALQYMLKQDSDSVESRAARVNAVLAGIWKELYQLDSIFNLQNYVEASGDLLDSSLTWNDFIQLFYGSYHEAIEHLSYLEVDENNLQTMRDQMKSIVEGQ